MAKRLSIRVDAYAICLLGMVALGLLLPARDASQEVVENLAYAGVCGLFFLYGARLAPSAVWAGMANWRLQSLVLVGTFLLFPAIGLAIGLVAKPHLPAGLASGLVFLSLLPSTVQSSIAFTSIARGNVPAALCSASLSNLAGVILTPLLFSIFYAGYHGLSGGNLGSIALQILLPFVVGQALRPLIGGWLEKHRLLTTLFDRGSILIIVYSAFSKGTSVGVWHLVSGPNLCTLLALDFLMLCTVVATMTLISRWLGFSTEDEVAIVFCGSKKSMASGLPMANILFPGQAVALIVLPLLIFHQVQLFACATLARRYAARITSKRIERFAQSTPREACR